jgi:hypothetical protein
MVHKIPSVEGNLLIFGLVCDFCPGSPKKSTHWLPNRNKYLTSREFLDQACQTQTHVRAAQLYSKTEKLPAGRSFETFSRFLLFKTPVTKLFNLSNFELR